jgi:P-type Ca2+ transporter type 2C
MLHAGKAFRRKVLAQFRDPLVYLLLGVIAISLLTWVVEDSAGAPVDAIVIAVIERRLHWAPR